jgi:hypothetical protein
MLSKQQFEKKHATKYAKLTAEQKSKRYQDYVNTQKGQTKSKPRVRQRRGGGDSNPINAGRTSRAVEQNQVGNVPYRTQQRRAMPYKQSGGNNVKLSSCGKNYITGLLNPFQYFDSTGVAKNRVVGMSGGIPKVLPCVPTFPSVKSRRLALFIRGNMSAGAFNDMVFAYAPRRAANNYTPTDGGAPPLYVSNGSLDPGSAFPLNLDVPGAMIGPTFSGLNFNSDYTIGQLGHFVTVRLVCAGMRIRYTGTTMNQSGTIHAIEEPNHLTLNQLDVAQISQYESYFRCPVKQDKWCSLYYNPVHPDEFEYDLDANLDIPVSGQFYTQPKNHHFMGFIVTGLQAASSFDYEAVSILEVVGSNVRDLIPAESDLKSVEIANNHLNPANGQQQNENPKAILETVMKSGGEFTETLIKGAETAFNVAKYFV